MTQTNQQILEYALERARKSKTTFEADCDIAVYAMERCELRIMPHNRFFVTIDCEKLPSRVTKERKEKFSSLIADHGLQDGENAKAFTGRADFGHINTEWESVISLGIYGLRQRIARYSESCSDPEKQGFYNGLTRVWDAALSLMKRAAGQARAEGYAQMADGLERLTHAAPATLYEALQTSVLYYTLLLQFDGTALRTMGRLDSLLSSFYQKELPEYADRLLTQYLEELNAFEATANMPFALGGTDREGNSAESSLTYRLLELYRASDSAHLKLHLLCTHDTPRDLLELAMEAVREGRNSIVFLSDKRVVDSLVGIGASVEDARLYHVVGCYECGAEGEITCSCNGRVNIPKAVEYALSGGLDLISGKLIGLPTNKTFARYEEFEAEVQRQLRHLCACAMRTTDLWEERYADLHTAPILSGTYTSALEAGADLYASYTARYNNSSINGLGLATATDSLMAIKRLVFEERRLSLDELTDLLRRNWANAETLRLLVKNRFDKFGNGKDDVDEIARRLVDTMADTVNGAPNVKGGCYRLGLFSIDWRWAFGQKTAASADGRLAGEPLSQNSGATFGADRLGATAHLSSVASLDTLRTPNGTIVDVDLHSSAVCGKNGLAAMIAGLLGYFELGGFAVHYNVLNTEILRKAKENPALYPNLQVRLCGWNVLFSSLSETEKEEFIRRSETAEAAEGV